MDITPRITSDLKVLQSYKGGRFKISGEVFDGAVIVTPENANAWCAAKTVEDLSNDDFNHIIAEKQDDSFEVLIIGTGEDYAFLSEDLNAYLNKHNIRPELMNSGAACRTFNVLLSEGRRVILACLPAA